MTNKNRWLLIFVLFHALFLQTLVSYATNIDKIVVFGDSLSDNGNLYTNVTESNVPKSPPYYEGRFTNGPVWVENLALAMNVPLSDYAYGGSWVEDLFPDEWPIPGLTKQVNQLYKMGEGLTDKTIGQHLFIVWSGANDYLNGRSEPEQVTTDTTNILKDNIDTLIQLGARNLMVVNLPDLSVVPGIKAEGEEFALAAKELIDLHNAKLADIINAEKIANPNVKIILVDITTYFADMIAHPAKYNLKNVTDSCYTGGLTSPKASLQADNHGNLLSRLKLEQIDR